MGEKKKEEIEVNTYMSMKPLNQADAKKLQLPLAQAKEEPRASINHL